MEVKLQILEIFPSLPEIAKTSDIVTLSIFCESTYHTKNMHKAINDQSILSFQAKEKRIQIYLNKNNGILGHCDYTLSNEIRWLPISNTSNANSGDSIRLRIKCSINDPSSNTILSSSLGNVKKLQIHKVKKKSEKTIMKENAMIKSPMIQSKSINQRNKNAIENHLNRHKRNKSIKSLEKLQHNKTCEDEFENMLLTEGPVCPSKDKNRSFHQYQSQDSHCKESRSKANGNAVKNYNNLQPSMNSNNNQLQTTITPNKMNHVNKHGHDHRHNNPNQIQSVHQGHCQGHIQTTTVNNRNNSYEDIAKYPKTYLNQLQASSITSKLDDKFKTYEDNIIDKTYENIIKKDEMLAEDKGLIDKMFTTDNSNGENDSKAFDSFNNDMNNLMRNNQALSSFQDCNENFELLYTNDYFKDIKPDTDSIKLELQVLIENICELQEAYHQELFIGMKKYDKYKQLFVLYSEKYIGLNKQSLNLKHRQERAHLTNTFHTFINNHKLKHNTESLRINRQEILFWNKLPLYSSYIKARSAIKENVEDIKKKKRLMELFMVITKKSRSQMNNIEKKLCDGTMIKHSRTRSMEEPDLNHHHTMKDTNNANNGITKDKKEKNGNGKNVLSSHATINKISNGNDLRVSKGNPLAESTDSSLKKKDTRNSNSRFDKLSKKSKYYK